LGLKGVLLREPTTAQWRRKMEEVDRFLAVAKAREHPPTHHHGQPITTGMPLSFRRLCLDARYSKSGSE
jgi:hypothetical protein